MIEINGLNKYFSESGVLSLDNVTMTIPDNKIVGLIGINGAGKSTLLRILAGIYRQDTGTVSVDGERVYENNNVKSKIAYISDDQYYQPGMTMKKMAMIHSSLREGFSIKKFYELAGKFGLDVNRRLSGFSKGMRRQSDIVTALSYGAKYLLCDETFDGLDPITRELTKKIFMEEMLDNNATILMSSHNLREMEDICDRIVLINRGKLVLSADLEDLRGTVYKYQLVFTEDIGEGFGEVINVVQPQMINHSGRMISFVAEGANEDVEEKINAAATERGYAVAYIEALPLSLEEIFMYKVRASGIEAGGLLNE
ncbi:MAG: ABC transporter ATP-binding protein [Firmicutes bacterium]|nr:ABC transporter ATP-binding protein [[Eubacterium] siraeum]MCM1486980.1 ABC transporter ATP-binding protein [Bacillota bacterium]